MEAIATTTVLAVVGSITSSVVLRTATGYRDAAAVARLHADASMAIERIVRELRGIPLDGTGGGGLPGGLASIGSTLSSLTTSSVAWVDGAVTQTLDLSGSDLRVSDSSGAMRTLVGDVSAFTIRPYDDGGSLLSGLLGGVQLASVRRLEVQLTLTRQGVSETLRTRVFLRSVMTGAGI